MLRHLVNQVHNLLAESVGFLHGVGLGVNADDGLGVRLAKVNPLVGEVNLHTVDVGHLLVLVEFLHLLEHGIDIRGRAEVNAVLGDVVLRQRVAELGSAHTRLGQIRQQQGHTYEGIAAAVGCGVDDTTIAFAADDGTRFLHLRHNVHFANGCRRVVATILLRHIAQTAGGGQVADGVARRMLEHVVGNGHKRVLLAKHGAVLADEGKAVHIGVNHEADVVAALAHKVANLGEVLLEGFRIVGKVARSICVDARHLGHAELAEELGQDDAADRVDRINGHIEMSAANSINVHEFKVLHQFDMALVVGQVLDVAAQGVNVGKLKVAVVGQTYNLRSLFGLEELALLVKEFEGVPLAGVMAGSNDDTTHGLLHSHSQFGGRRRSQTDIHHVEAHTHERAADNVHHHFARQTCIATNDNLAAIVACHFLVAQAGVGRYRLGNVNRIERVTGLTANRSAEARDGFD